MAQASLDNAIKCGHCQHYFNTIAAFRKHHNKFHRAVVEEEEKGYKKFEVQKQVETKTLNYQFSLKLHLCLQCVKVITEANCIIDPSTGRSTLTLKLCKDCTERWTCH